ncbi:MAG: putative bifunctional diguanylate cyclase/phosphodiesterase [Acidimicrobiales bacterium]
MGKLSDNGWSSGTTTPAWAGGGTAGDGPGRLRHALATALAAREPEILAFMKERYRSRSAGGADFEDDPLWNISAIATQSIVRWLRTGESANVAERTEISSVGGAAAHERDLVAREFARTMDPVPRGGRSIAPLPRAAGEPAGDGTTNGPGPGPGAAPAGDGGAAGPGGDDDHPRPGVGRLSVAMLTRMNLWWSEITCRILAEEGQGLGASGDLLDEVSAMVVRSSQASLVGMAKRFDAEIESLHQRLAEQALRDTLTGLSNRMALIDQLDRALAHLARSPDGLAVVYVDVDDFKAVNDVYGHACGDAVLFETAARLLASVRPGDVVARLGGDEFVVLFEGLSNPAAEGQRRAEQIRVAAAEPITVDGGEVRVTISAGVATVELSGRLSEEVLARADGAMYSAKRAGRNRVAVVEIDEGTDVVSFATTAGLHQALERRELRLVYQPVYDSRRGTVAGFEALLRWDHPERGVVPPLDFIPIAEESGLMVEIGEWVLKEACRQAMEWAKVMGTIPRMAVNVSARQLDDRDFVRRVARILEATGMAATSLVLEITETVLLGEDVDHQSTLTVLKDLGVQLAIDDFGTGYSSLAYLRRLPVDQLKVDRSFVKDVAEHGDTRIMLAVVRLAHDLGLEVVAEGVETNAELRAVRDLGCDVVQGFLLGRPVPPSCVDLVTLTTPSLA